MADKNGTVRERRATLFPRTPTSAISACPFKGTDIAIVPVRYALDRSRFDVASKTLKPLSKAGIWPELPALHTRSYTLRQLYDGYVYVFDETAETFHEYTVNAQDAALTRIVWSKAHLGKDVRSASASDARPYLSYPRNHRLSLAFSPRQWSWRLCERMRSEPESRARWMTALDLARYRVTMAEPGTLPLRQMAEVAADIDAGQAAHDGRFDDSCVSTTLPDADQGQCSPAGADVRWLGCVPDQDSALLIALNDPLAVLTDLGLQLATEQAALQAWQAEHEHKVQMAQVVTNLCASSDDPTRLPTMVKHDVARTQAYLGELDAYLERRQLQQIECRDTSSCNNAVVEVVTMAAALRDKYGVLPTEQDFESWTQRSKWRQEVDVIGARAHISMHKPVGDRLMQELYDTQNDLMLWAEHIGLDPHALFIDTEHPDSLLYLQSLMSDLLAVLVQDIQTHGWLLKQEDTPTSLFGTLRYGFSPSIKHALDQEADRLLNGLNDHSNLATRIGEFNALLNHSEVAGSRFMNSLKGSARQTLKTLGELAAGQGKAVAQTLLTAWVPLDSRRVRGKHQSLPALLRSLIIGRVLTGSTERLALDADAGNRLKHWKRELRVLTQQIQDLQSSWQSPSIARHDRRSLSRQLQQLQTDLRQHYLRIPELLDFQDKHYSRLMHNEMRAFLESNLSLEHWQPRAEAWAGRLLTGAAVGITWGVVMINFISTAFLMAELTRDGAFGTQDMIKVSYGLAYTGSLLMGIYVAAPWAVIKAAQPERINSRLISILERSASYWAARGNKVWADAVRSFKVGMLAMGVLGLVGAALELVDIYHDYKSATTQEERLLLISKSFAVAIMGAGGIVNILATVLPKFFAAFAMSGLMAGVLLVAGLAYLLITMLLNALKQDSVGLWLRKCCWSRSRHSLYPDTDAGIAEERNHLTAIILSPKILVKQTSTTSIEWMGRIGYQPTEKQTGAWIQILLPAHLRGHSIDFFAISSERTWNMMEVRKSEGSIMHPFLNNGLFENAASFGSVTTQTPSEQNSLRFPTVPPLGEDIVWRTWVPLQQEADFIELQIWYPDHIVNPGTQDVGYLYQIELSRLGEAAVDGLLPLELEVKSLTRNNAAQLELPQ
jgi:hypothetical protein